MIFCIFLANFRNRLFKERSLEGRQRDFRKENGLTLIEVVNVLAIISILSAIGIPTILTWLPYYRLRAAARDLNSNFQRTKLEAIRSGGECAIYFDSSNSRYQVVGGGPDGICDGTPHGDPPISQNDDELITYVTLSDYGSGVCYGNGGATRTVSGSGALPVTVSYSNKWVRFNTKGMAREMGYAYLTNSEGSAYAIGTPSFAGAIVMKKWGVNLWE